MTADDSARPPSNNAKVTGELRTGRDIELLPKMTGRAIRPMYETFGSHRFPNLKTTILWRYFDFEKFCWLIDTANLYHARLDHLGDPYEGSVTIPYARKRDSGEIHGYMDSPGWEPLNNRRLMVSSYATCWHASDNESPSMWKLYSHERRGVAIVSTFERLRTAADTSDFHLPLLGPVEYFDYGSDDMSLPMGLTGRVGFSKMIAFEHEREIRGIVRIDDQPNNPNEIFSEAYSEELAERLPNGVEVPIDLHALIERIVVAPKSDLWFKKHVQLTAERRGLAQAVRSSELLEPPVY